MAIFMSQRRGIAVLQPNTILNVATVVRATASIAPTDTTPKQTQKSKTYDHANENFSG